MAFAVAIIWPSPLSVVDYAAAGRAPVVPRPQCPSCCGPMWFWFGYSRHVRAGGRELQIWIRRGRCRRCRVTHALLPHFLLLRRLDTVTDIGGALLQAVRAGAGHRTIATGRGLPPTTVRGWQRRHRARAPALAAAFSAWTVALGGMPPVLRGAPEWNALVAMSAVWVRARASFAGRIGDAWQLASAITGGDWLGTNTSPLWAGLDLSGLMRSERTRSTREEQP